MKVGSLASNSDSVVGPVVVSHEGLSIECDECLANMML